VGVSSARNFSIEMYFSLFISFLNCFSALFNFALSCGDLEFYHFLRSFLFSAILSLMFSGQCIVFPELCIGGVDSQAAFCILVLKLSIANSISSLVFSDIFQVICSFNRSLKCRQFVFTLDKVRGRSIFTTAVFIVIIIGK